MRGELNRRLTDEVLASGVDSLRGVDIRQEEVGHSSVCLISEECRLRADRKRIRSAGIILVAEGKKRE